MRKFTLFMALALIVSAANAQQKMTKEQRQLFNMEQRLTQPRKTGKLHKPVTQQSIQTNTPISRSPQATIYSEGFESTTGTALPTGWTQTGTSFVTMSDAAELPNCGDPFSPHGGSRMLGRSWANSGNYWLFSSGISLTGGQAYTISFWYSAPGWEEAGEYDDFEVRIGTTASSAMGSANLVFSRIGSRTAPYPYDWTEGSGIFTPETSGTYYIGFHDLNPSQTGLWIIIDDVSVANAAANDAAITAITAPVSGQNLSATEPVTATIKNNGTNAITSMTLELTVDEGTPVTEVFSGNLASGAQLNYTLTHTADVSAAGTHTVKVRAILTDDGNPNNDAMTVTIKNTICNIGSLPIYQDFEDMDANECWTMISNNVVNGPDGTANIPMGVYFFDDIIGNIFLFGSYNSATDYSQYLISPEFSASTAIVHISLDAAMYDGWTGETFKIGYSTTTNNIAAFNWSAEQTATNDIYYGDPFQHYEYTAPVGTKYVAIWYTSQYEYYLVVDNIAIEEAQDNDAAITAITAPVSGQNLSATEPVTATIKNNGANAITAMTLELTVDEGTPITEAFSGDIAAGANMNYTFTHTADVSAAGTHTVKVKAILTGDGNPNNDAMTKTITNIICGTINSFPWNEDFENSLAGVPACWTVYDVDGTPPTWAINTSSSYVHGGNSSVGHVYDCGTNQEGWLVSPKISLPAGVYNLSFWSINDWPGDEEYNGVLISTTDNSPSSFTEIKVLSGDEVSSSWKQIQIPLSAYAGQDIYIAFKYTGECADSWYIDDLNITEVFGTDAAISNIVAPISGINLTSTEQVIATIKNEGADPITTAQMKLTVDASAPVTETFTGNILAGYTANFTFAATADLSAEGTHTITVEVIMPGDENADNNSMTKIVTNTICGAVALPYFENFDASTDLPPCWSTIDADGDGNTWWIRPSDHNGYPEYDAYSLENFATSQSWINYVAIQPDNYLVTPPIAIPANGASLNYMIGESYNDDGDNEHYEVLVSTTGTNISDFTDVLLEETLTTTSWVPRTNISLAAYAGQTIYIAFRHFNCYDVELLKLDDVSIMPLDEVTNNNPSRNIAVYPNPVTTTFVIKNAAGSQAKIYDVSGKMVYTAPVTTDNQTVDISNVSAGIYFLELQSSTSKSTVKLIKK